MAVCVGWMQDAAPKVPKTGAEKKSTKGEGRGTPIRIVLLNWRCQISALCLLQVAGQATKNRASGRVCDASDARKQPGCQKFRDVCKIKSDSVQQRGRLMEWQVSGHTDRFFPCLSLSGIGAPIKSSSSSPSASGQHPCHIVVMFIAQYHAGRARECVAVVIHGLCSPVPAKFRVEEEITLSQPTVPYSSPLITVDGARKEDLLLEARRKGPHPVNTCGCC